MKKKRISYALWLLGGSVLAACVSGNQSPTGRQAIPSALLAMHWQLDQVREGARPPRQDSLSGVAFSQYRLDIKGDTVHLGGGCNAHFGAVYLTGQDGLSFGPLASTEKGCTQPLMQADIEVANLLASVSNFRLEQTLLTLFSANQSLSFHGIATDESRYGQAAITAFIELRTPPTGLVWRKATYDSDWIQNNKNAPWSNAPFPGIENFSPETNRHYIVRVDAFKDRQAGREVWIKDMVVMQSEL